MRFLAILALLAASSAFADDWPMGGRTNDRNPVSLERKAPVDWQLADDGVPARNIRWTARVGIRSNGGPVVAGGFVWVGTSNREPLDPKVVGDRGVLACFRELDGKLVYTHSSPRHPLGRYADWPSSSLSGSPIAEKDRLWFVTNRREVVCLDTSPLHGGNPALPVWTFDMIAKLGIVPNSPHFASPHGHGSPAIHKDRIYVPTGNGTGIDHPAGQTMKAPNAPSLVCLDKRTGNVVWTTSSASKLGYDGDTASPLIVDIGGQAQVIQPQSDGWVRSYDAATGKLLWSFDVSPRDARWGELDVTRPRKHVVTARPIIAKGRVYFAVGRDPEWALGPGRLFCVDPTKAGDISPELESGAKNPNSGLFWDFTRGGRDEATVMRQTIAAIAVHEGLAIAVDRDGVHCLDAVTGKHHWSHAANDVLADPLIVDGKIYIANRGSMITILALSNKLSVIANRKMDDTPIDAPPVFANGTLYILTSMQLVAIRSK